MIFVTGSRGHLGAAVLEHLTARGVPFVAGSRSPGDGERLVDFDRPEALDLSGVSTLLLISAGYGEDDVVIGRHAAAIGAAERDGVRHVVYTSLTGVGDHLAFALPHRWTEQRLESSGMTWTVLRNGLYAELFGGLIRRQDAGLVSAFGGGALAAVARADLAEAAALVAATPEAHRDTTYELVGNQAISTADVAAELGLAWTGEDLASARRGLAGTGLLPFQPAMLMSIFSAVRHGFLAEPGEELTRLLGRPPRSATTAAVRALPRPPGRSPHQATTTAGAAAIP